MRDPHLVRVQPAFEVVTVVDSRLTIVAGVLRVLLAEVIQHR